MNERQEQNGLSSSEKYEVLLHHQIYTLHTKNNLCNLIIYGIIMICKTELLMKECYSLKE